MSAPASSATLQAVAIVVGFRVFRVEGVLCGFCRWFAILGGSGLRVLGLQRHKKKHGPRLLRSLGP